jgi:hypothetical protein
MVRAEEAETDLRREILPQPNEMLLPTGEASKRTRRGQQVLSNEIKILNHSD